jgi:hypothetical protein
MSTFLKQQAQFSGIFNKLSWHFNTLSTFITLQSASL